VYTFTEADYVDGREELDNEVPDLPLRNISDAAEIQRLARLNRLLERMVAGSSISTAELKTALTLQQYADYLDSITNPKQIEEVLYGSGIPEELHSYNRKLQAADFQNANLSGAVMSLANMGERPMEKRTLLTNFEDANLRRADLSGANLHLANFSNAYLREANLSGADLSDALLTKANLKGANLTGANLKGAKLDDTKLEDAKFCKTIMPDGAVNDSGC
jgi:uncharacterized protein YjbI with pentapeptide repeats